MPTETSIVNAIKRKLKELGAVVRKSHGGGYGTVAGDPDLYGCYRGIMFQIEVKVPGNYPTKLQRIRLREWADAGAVTGVAWCVDDIYEILGIEKGDEE